MTTLDELADISISVSTQSLTLPGFGKALILVQETHANFDDRVREYSSSKAMTDEGFSATSLAVRAAQMFEAANPAVQSFMIGKRLNLRTQTVKFTPKSAVQGTKYSIKIKGSALNPTVITRTVPGASSLAAEATAIAALIDPLADVAAVAVAGVITVTTGTPGLTVEYSEFSHSLLEFEDVTADPGIVADFNACFAEEENFYAISYDAVGSAEFAAMAPVAEANKRRQDYVFSDTKIMNPADTTSIWSLISVGSYAYSSCGFHKYTNTLAAVARLAVCLPYDPGSETWSSKRLPIVPVDSFTAGERSALRAKKGWYYTSIAGNGNTVSGDLGDTGIGEWSDVVRFLDWQKIDLQAAAYAVSVATPKTAFDDTGISGYQSALTASLGRGERVGGFVKDSTAVVVPKASSFTASQRKARALTGITFSGLLAGAIHRIVARGTVSA